jgi:hypothetical protein
VGTCYHEGVRWAALILAGLVGIAGAGPQVTIRAETELGLTRVRLRDTGEIEVVGRLVDKNTGEGLGGEGVVVVIGGQPASAITAPDGTFMVTVNGEPGTQQIQLQFRGAGGLDAAKPMTVTTDPSKAHVELAIARHDDASGPHFVVHATSDDGATNVSLQLELAAGDGPWRPLRTVPSDQAFALTRKDTGGPGQFRLRASFAGDVSRQPAEVEGTFELTAATKTSMDIRHTSLAFEDDLVVTGKVLDEDSRPVARAALTLTSADKRLAQSASDEQGAYQFHVEAQLLGECGHRPCRFAVQVQADPNSSYLLPSRSDPAEVSVAAPQPVPVTYTVAAFLATALAAGGFFLARIKPWRRLRRPAPPAEVPTVVSEVAPAHGGLVVAKPGMISTLRRAQDDGFSGVVRDTVRGRPVAHAAVRLLLGDHERELRSGGDGSFAVEKLPHGEWRAEVAAPGHITERFALTIPHRGELRGVRIDLVPVRERVFQLYRRAAEPILPDVKLWGIWSPRQIVDHVRRKRPTPALAELTDFVEEVYFSPRLVAETVIPHASERVDRAIQERAQR